MRVYMFACSRHLVILEFPNMTKLSIFKAIWDNSDRVKEREYYSGYSMCSSTYNCQL